MPVASHSGFSESHQYISLGTKLKNLVTFTISTRVLTIWSLTIGYPDIPLKINMQPVGPNEHLRTKASQLISF